MSSCGRVCPTVYVCLCIYACLFVCVYLKSNSLDMFEGRTTLTKLLRFAFLHAHVRTRVWTFTMYVDRSNAAHCNTHVFYKSTVCAYLMGMCVALQQCTCVVSSIRNWVIFIAILSIQIMTFWGASRLNINNRADWSLFSV